MEKLSTLVEKNGGLFGVATTNGDAFCIEDYLAMCENDGIEENTFAPLMDEYFEELTGDSFDDAAAKLDFANTAPAHIWSGHGLTIAFGVDY